VLAVEAVETAWHLAFGIVPDVDVIAVSIEDDRTLTILLFQSVSIEPGLCATVLRIVGCALDFDERQGLAVVIPEHIIDIALARVSWLVRDLYLFAYFAGTVVIRPDMPSRLDQKLIDEQLACRCLVKLQCIGSLTGLRQNGLLLLDRLLSGRRLPSRRLQ